MSAFLRPIEVALGEQVTQQDWHDLRTIARQNGEHMSTAPVSQIARHQLWRNVRTQAFRHSADMANDHAELRRVLAEALTVADDDRIVITEGTYYTFMTWFANANRRQGGMKGELRAIRASRSHL